MKVCLTMRLKKKNAEIKEQFVTTNSSSDHRANWELEIKNVQKRRVINSLVKPQSTLSVNNCSTMRNRAEESH